jgi:hypothetical protein
MNDPKTFATIMFLAAPPTNRKSDAAIWLSANKRRYCLKNLTFHKIRRVKKASDEYLVNKLT